MAAVRRLVAVGRRPVLGRLSPKSSYPGGPKLKDSFQMLEASIKSLIYCHGRTFFGRCGHPANEMRAMPKRVGNKTGGGRGPEPRVLISDTLA
jgi:hypothetical protein